MALAEGPTEVLDHFINDGMYIILGPRRDVH